MIIITIKIQNAVARYLHFFFNSQKKTRIMKANTLNSQS